MATIVRDTWTSNHDKTACPTCAGCEIRSIIRTPETVYLRCGLCGYVWGMPERRGKAHFRAPQITDTAESKNG
jgi:hypothetical protein